MSASSDLFEGNFMYSLFCGINTVCDTMIPFKNPPSTYYHNSKGVWQEPALYPTAGINAQGHTKWMLNIVGSSLYYIWTKIKLVFTYEITCMNTGVIIPSSFSRVNVHTVFNTITICRLSRRPVSPAWSLIDPIPQEYSFTCSVIQVNPVSCLAKSWKIVPYNFKYRNPLPI